MCYFYKCINGSLPGYLNEHLVINNTQYNRSTRYASFNPICPYYKRETEGGRCFAVSAARLWNNVPLITRKLDSVKSLKTNLFNTMFAAQQRLEHVRFKLFNFVFNLIVLNCIDMLAFLSILTF